MVDRPVSDIQRSPMARSIALDQIRRWAELRDEGLLTEDEFQQLKKQILVDVGLLPGEK